MSRLEEHRVLDRVAECHGREWAEEHRELVLAQVRLVGELKSEDRS